LSTAGRDDWGLDRMTEADVREIRHVQLRSAGAYGRDGRSEHGDLALAKTTPDEFVEIARRVLSGLGTLQLEGSSRLVVPGDLDTTAGINLLDSAQLIVPGTYTIRT